jgi:HAD superfamily hydrolase (TIGR01490 family)
VLRNAYAQLVFLVGGTDHAQMEKMRGVLSQMVVGWNVETVREIVSETLHSIVDPLVYDEAVTLIEEHHRLGRDVIIVSASGSEMVNPIGDMLGADAVIASRLAVREGRYTGEIEYYAYAQNKAAAIAELAEERGYDLGASYAYSDSVTDIHMLEVVGHPHAVNPDKELRRAARERGWPVLTFSRQVALATRMRLPSRRSALTALALGAVLTASGAAVVRVRRRLVRLTGAGVRGLAAAPDSGRPLAERPRSAYKGTHST